MSNEKYQEALVIKQDLKKAIELLNEKLLIAQEAGIKTLIHLNDISNDSKTWLGVSVKTSVEI